MKFEQLPTPDKQFPYPSFAEKMMSKELIDEMDGFIQFGRDFDGIIGIDDPEQVTTIFLESEDIYAITTLLASIGDKIVERAQQRSKHRDDAVSRAMTSVENIIDSQIGSGGVITMQICEGLQEYVTAKLILDSLEKEFDGDYESLLEEPVSGNDHKYINLQRSWVSFNSVIDSFKNMPSSFWDEEGQDDDEFSHELAESLLYLNSAIKLPPLVLQNLFQNTPLENYVLSFQGIQGMGKKHIFGMAPATIHIVDKEDLGESKIADFSKITNESNGLSMQIFTGVHSSSMFINYSGDFSYVGNNIVAPIATMPMDKESRKTFKRLRLKILMEIHQLYEDLFESIEEKKIDPNEDAQTMEIELPEYARPYGREGKTITLPQSPAELVEIVKEVKKSKKVDVPSVNAGKILRSLTQLGCKVIRQKGSHMMIQSPTGEMMPLPNHGTKDIKKGTMMKLLKGLSISKNDFVDNL